MKKLLIIPAIDLSSGHCARCILGEPGMEALYQDMSNHRVQVAQVWRRENAKCIHVTDTDSFAGRDDVATLAAAVLMQKAVDIPIELVTWQQDPQVLRDLLDAGIYRVAVNDLLHTNPESARELVAEYGNSRVAFAIRAHAGVVEFSDGSTRTDLELIQLIYSLGGTRVIYSERDWEGALTGEDIDVIQRVASVAPVRFTMAGGIASPQDLWDLQERAPRNVDSVVIGRALYENRFPCQRIWRYAEAQLEPIIHDHLNDGQQSSISKL